MLKLFTFCIDTCINSLYKTVFYSVDGFSIDHLTFSCYRILETLIIRMTVVWLNGFSRSGWIWLNSSATERYVASSFANIKTNLTLSCIVTLYGTFHSVVSLGKTLYGTFPCLVVLASSSKLQ